MCQLMIMLLEVIIKSCQNLKQCQLRSKKVLHNWPQAIVHVPPSLPGLDRVRPRILRPRHSHPPSPIYFRPRGKPG